MAYMNVKGFLSRFWTNVEPREKLVRVVVFYQVAIFVFETSDERQELSKREEESQKINSILRHGPNLFHEIKTKRNN